MASYAIRGQERIGQPHTLDAANLEKKNFIHKAVRCVAIVAAIATGIFAIALALGVSACLWPLVVVAGILAIALVYILCCRNCQDAAPEPLLEPPLPHDPPPPENLPNSSPTSPEDAPPAQPLGDSPDAPPPPEDPPDPGENSSGSEAPHPPASGNPPLEVADRPLGADASPPLGDVPPEPPLEGAPSDQPLGPPEDALPDQPPDVPPPGDPPDSLSTSSGNSPDPSPPPESAPPEDSPGAPPPQMDPPEPEPPEEAAEVNILTQEEQQEREQREQLMQQMHAFVDEIFTGSHWHLREIGIGQPNARMPDENLTKLREILDAAIDCLEKQSLEHMRTVHDLLVGHMQGGRCDSHRLIALDYQYTQDVYKFRVPIVDFIITITENPEMWDKGLQWYHMQSDGICSVEDYQRRWISLQGVRRQMLSPRDSWVGPDRSGVMLRHFCACNLPLGDKLYGALDQIYQRTWAALKCSQETFRRKLGEECHSTQIAFDSMMQSIGRYMQSFRTIPLSENDVFYIYNHYLRQLITGINTQLSRQKYEEIDFADILLPEEETADDPTASATGMLARTTTLAIAADGALLPLLDVAQTSDSLRRAQSAFRLILDAKKLQGPFLRCLRRVIQRRFSIDFVGSGLVSSVFLAHVVGHGYKCVRLLQPDELEAAAFVRPTLSLAFDSQTRANPNLSGRMLVCAKVGQRFAELFGCHSPAIDTIVLSGSDDSTVLAMTHAGRQTLYAHMHTPEFTVTNEFVYQSIILQIFYDFVGQIDGHQGNACVDAAGDLRAIDYGMTFPPVFITLDNDETLSNFARAFCANGQRSISADLTQAQIKDRLQKRDDLRHVLPRLPPLTRRMKSGLEQMTSDEGKQWMREMLTQHNFTPREIAAAIQRLDLIREQLPHVPIVKKKNYLKLYQRGFLASLFFPSLTEENCLLKVYRRGQ